MYVLEVSSASTFYVAFPQRLCVYGLYDAFNYRKLPLAALAKPTEYGSALVHNILWVRSIRPAMRVAVAYWHI